MLKIFIDSDIILDLLIMRNEYKSSAELFTRIINKEIEGFTTPIVITNVHYINTKYEGKNKSIESLRKLRKILSILTIDEKIVDEALFSKGQDFEDSIQYITAEKNNLDFIITRNKKDYRECRLPVLTASEFLRLI